MKESTISLKRLKLSAALRIPLIWHISAICAIIAAVIMLYFSRTTHLGLQWNSGDTFGLLLPLILVAIALSFSYLYFRRQLEVVQHTNSFESKIKKYQTALTRYYLLIGFPAIPLLSIYAFNGQFVYLALTLVLCLILIGVRPTERKTLSHLEKVTVK